MLATALVHDIVGSTQRAAELLANRRWRKALKVGDELGNRMVERWGGWLANKSTDDILATFAGRAVAIGCAAAFRDQLANGEIGIRPRPPPP